MIYFVNAFSLNMLDIDGPVEIQVFPLQKDDVRNMLVSRKATHAIGHKETADILSGMLDMEITNNRTTVKIEEKDAAIVAQYKGPRLEEGATKLPEGAEIKFYLARASGGI